MTASTKYEMTLPNGWLRRITVLSPYVWRVLTLPPEGLALTQTFSVIHKDGSDAPREGLDVLTLGNRDCEPITVEGDELSNGNITCQVDPATGNLTWLRDNKWIAGDRAFGDSWRVEGSEFGRRGFSHFMTAHDDDWVCGLGDKTGAVNQMGRRFRLAARDALGFNVNTDPLYKHWPFWHIRHGDQFYAQLYLNHAEGNVDFGCERSGYYITPGVTYRTWQSSGGNFDQVLFFGRTPEENLAHFYALTGQPIVRPDWALGFQFTSMAIPDADEPDKAIDELLGQFDKHHIPVRAFHFGSGYQRHGYRRMAMVWNRERYPNPQATLGKFKTAGLPVAANIKPSIFEDHPERNALEAIGAFVTDKFGEPISVRNWDGPAALVDYSSEAGYGWWRDAAKERILSTGIEVVWNDNNEYEIWDEDALLAGFGTPVRFQDVRTALTIPMCRASLDAQKAVYPERQTHSITRSAVPGCQRYAETWSGDNYTGWAQLAASIDQTNVMALSGLPITGHDVGGFYGPSPDAELLLRYVQAYCLLPRFVMNSWKPETQLTVPWMHEDVIEPIRNAMLLREELMPMLRQFEDERRWLRAPQQAFPNDEQLFEKGCQGFMVGDWLVAPVVKQGASKRAIYLPDNGVGWIERASGETFGPGEKIKVAVDLTSLPIFMPKDQNEFRA